MLEREQSARFQRVSAALQGECGTERVIEILARTGLIVMRATLTPDT